MAMLVYTVSDRLFQTHAAAAGKTRSLKVARRVRGAMSADVLEERNRRRALRCETSCSSVVRFLPWRQRYTAPPTGTKSVVQLEVEMTGNGFLHSHSHDSLPFTCYLFPFLPIPIPYQDVYFVVNNKM